MDSVCQTEWNIDEAVQSFMEAGFNDGDIVSKEWIEWALQINESAMRENAFLLLERMESLKQTLLVDHRIALQNVRGKGYRIVPPAEQAEFAAKQAAYYIEKGLKKSNSLLAHTRRESLTTDERKRHTDTEIRVAALTGMVSKGKRDVFRIFSDK